MLKNVMIIVLSCLTHVMYAQLSGTVTVPGTYPTLAAAINDLNSNGISGVTTIEVSANQAAPSGGYVINAVAGSSATNTLTIKAIGAIVLTAPTGTSTTIDGVIKLNGADNLTIEGFTIAENALNNTQTTQMEWGIAALNVSTTDACQNITIKNCSINLNGAVENANEVGIYAVHHSITSIFALRPTTAGGAFSNLKIVGCTIDNAYTGISVGYNGTNAFPETNLIIGENGAGNTITNFGGSSTQSNAIYVDFASNANVNYNTIDNTLLNTQTYGLDGIFVGNGVNQNITISYNTIKVRKTNLTSQLTAIRNLGYTGTVICNNNEITGCSADGSGTIILIHNQAACASLTVNSNNIHDNAGLNTTGNVALCYSSGAVANLTFNNNTLSNNQKSTITTGNFYGFGNIGTAANGVETVTNNIIINLGSATFQGTLFGFYSSTVATQSRTMSGNTINGLYGNNEMYAISVLNNNFSTLKFNKISNIVNNAGVIRGIYVLSNKYLVCTDNKISNIVMGGGTLYGIYAGTVNGSTISRDTLSNVTGTGGSVICEGFNIGFGTNNQINGCVINNINGVDKFTGLSLGGSITTNVYDNIIKNVVQTIAATINGIDAIVLNQSQINCVFKIYNNTLDSLTNRCSTTGNTNGILVNYATTVNIYKNKITNLRNEFGTTNRVNGVNFAVGTTANVYNNDIFNLFSGTSTDFACLNGLCLSSGSGNYTFYNNTIRLSGNVAGGANGLAILTTSIVGYANNIINVNVTAPVAFQVCAIRKQTTSILASNTNNNLYYVPNNSNAFYYIESNAAVFQRGFSPNATPTQGVSDRNFNQACSIYKSYMLGKESFSFYENTTFNGSIPTGTSYADSHGQSLALVTQDITGMTRGVAPDIGAYEFLGTNILTDNIAPTITISNIPNVICTNNIPITVNITDASGVKTATNKPRLWFKKTTEKDSLAANNTAAYNGWKYVEATNTTSPFLFNLDLSVLNTPAVAGNIIQLFASAEDNNGNVGASKVTFNNDFCASSVALDATAFPTQSMTPILTFSVIAAPASINTIASKSIICVSSTVDLSLSSATVLNLEYQWQGSATLNGTFVDIPSATSTTLTTTVNSTSHKAFRCQLKCGTTVVLASTPILIDLLNPQVLSTSPASRCDAGTLNLAATPSSGSTVNWYDAVTGGNPIATNTMFTTPSLSVSKNYYTEAVSTSVNKQSFANDGGWNHITTEGEFQSNTITDGRFMLLTLQESKLLSSLDIYPGAAIGNQYIIQARINNQYGPVVATYTGLTTVRCFLSSFIPQTVNVNWLLPAGTYYIGFTQNPYCWRSGTAGHAYPWTLDDNSASIYAQLSTDYQYYFYNFKFNKVCTSARVPVEATINDCPKISTKVLLSNANPTTRKMDDYVKSLPSFPLTDPYAAANAFSGNFTHVNKTTLSTVSPSVLVVTGDNAIVDWMFLELRKGTSGAMTVTHTQVGLLQKDGDVVAMDGVSPVQFNAPADNYYITMRHRNHLGFRTNAVYALSNSVTTLDFTNNTVALYGALPINQITPTLSVMNGGDANSDGSIDAFDSISWEMQNGLFDDYLQNADYNMDGSIDAFDSIVWEFNNGKYQELD